MTVRVCAERPGLTSLNVTPSIFGPRVSFGSRASGFGPGARPDGCRQGA